MLIDWFTVGAQALNFIVLVLLLRRFLYKPILEAIDAREKKIAAELKGAATKEAEAQKQREEFQHKNEELDAQRAALLKEATEEADAERGRLLDEARTAAGALSDKRRESLRNDTHTLHQAIRRRTQDEVFAIARKALTDLSTTTLEERIAEVFIRRVREMDDATKTTLADASRKSADPVVVRSAFELPEKERAAIRDELNRAFSAAVRVRFETAPELVGGIECATNGHKVGWNIAEYLGSLEERVAELLNERQTAEARVEPKPKLSPKVSKPEAKAEPKPQASPSLRPEATAEARPEPKPPPAPAAKSV